MFSQLDSSSKSAMMSKSAADIYASETNNLLHAKVAALEMDLKLHKESVMEVLLYVKLFKLTACSVLILLIIVNWFLNSPLMLCCIAHM